MASQRQLRVQELLVQEVSDILRREVKDPRIGFVTVTDAEISPDLRAARVFVSILGTAEQATDALRGLNSAAGFIRSEFGRRSNLRYNPTLEFRVDHSAERAARIHALLQDVQQSEDDGGSENSPGGEVDP